ncbi:MAG: HNH endonuclease [Rhodobacteraceae bacterium]|nr:HNH endonuclease [Paracoccaceae bacterium]
MSRKAKEQWATIGDKMLDSIRKANAKTRILFEHLSYGSFRMKKRDGRLFGYYWKNGRKRYMYRYQWVWISINGPIKPGYHIHHINGDCSDDRIENLEMISARAHRRLHGDENLRESARKHGRKCDQCRGFFVPKIRKDRPARYCSPACYHEANRVQAVCPVCSKTFSRAMEKGRKPVYCSRACFENRSRSLTSK